MYALVLCGGFAKRLEPIGEFVPKALLTVNGMPLIDYILEGLEKESAIKRIIISTNKKFERQFRYWLKLRQRAGLSKNVSLLVEPSTSNENKFGAVRGIAYAIEKAGIGDDMLVVAGDNFYTFEIGALISEMLNNHAPCVIAYDIKSKAHAKRFGVIDASSNGVIKEFYEKPAEPNSSIVSTGIYFIPKSYLGMVSEYVSLASSTDNIGDFISWLKNKTDVYAIVPKSGEWFDIGTIDGYRELFNNKLLGKKRKLA
ncbi:MAG: nucleotidyltransferase family protein [Candidatus Micrarchaeaceae archaeon]